MFPLDMTGGKTGKSMSIWLTKPISLFVQCDHCQTSYFIVHMTNKLKSNLSVCLSAGVTFLCSIYPSLMNVYTCKCLDSLLWSSPGGLESSLVYFESTKVHVAYYQCPQSHSFAKYFANNSPRLLSCHGVWKSVRCKFVSKCAKADLFSAFP